MVHLCQACDEPATRRCSGCKIPAAWYCSEKCQRHRWPLHIFECNPTKPINTAYHLARAVYQDRFPEDPQTSLDYGFKRAFTVENQSKLLGLYIGLILYIKVEPKTIHRWRLKGTMAEEIKSAFEKLPQSNRGSYYPWFLQNQWVINLELTPPTNPVDETLLRAWQYAGGLPTSTREEMDAVKASWPKHKQECFFFCTLLLSSWHPSPEQAAWLNFSFCTCRDEYSETPLAQLYQRLIALSSFDKIYMAYKSSELIALFDCKGLKHDQEQIHHLDDVLARSPYMHKSVWDLKQHVVLEDGCMIPSIAVNYVKLHEAAIGGRLFEYVGGFVKLKKKLKHLMKNPYLLPQATSSSGPAIMLHCEA
ncbi:hypothetical protein PILCRDRAFT_821715 [Piloderma croceum F 1598]|uniref:MYND-type domain-containing protein n=1 Tax=Piloderma croceum (strain F 1598) TaxID=765440 RepID=A0A0C3FQ01_PILCF|nr:hypothetical protein PILCRDRAFT_821715 [Piloderma croceum F 1598]